MAELTVCSTTEEMTTLSRSWIAEGHTIAVVPTMGALHRGHVVLIREALRRANRVVVTVFVNPTQFDRAVDLDAYPRDLAADLTTCEAEGVHAVFAPSVAEVYPQGATTSVDPGPIADRLEGEHRPGHFSGVATVVLRLFEIVSPHVAVFGEKDAQQLAIVRSVCEPREIDIVGVPTVRESDGLALSSRNVQLDPVARQAATALPRALESVNDAWIAGLAGIDELRARGIGIIEEAGGEVDYLDLVDPATFLPCSSPERGDLIVAAAWFGGVRLIDNLQLGS
ncbi:MAG: pantoate--beta-alanine ligase [Ilumatobacteraceae bacterium]